MICPPGVPGFQGPQGKKGPQGKWYLKKKSLILKTKFKRNTSSDYPRIFLGPKGKPGNAGTDGKKGDEGLQVS